MSLAVDIGALTVKVASDQEVTTIPAPSGGPRRGIRAALAAQSQRGGFCVAVPDAWLAGDVAGAGRQEDVRYECEDVAGTGPVVWTGQLAAVAALTAGQHGRGRYLVCDLGGSGVRAGMFDVSDGTVQIVSTHTADGGGWADFDAAIRSAVKSLQAGMPLVIYPEGGRTPDGEIKPFLPGAFFLAIKAQVDIVPVALVGTYELLPMDTYHIKCRPLEMRVGEPISTAGLKMRDMEAVSAKVKKELEDLYSAESRVQE